MQPRAGDYMVRYVMQKDVKEHVFHVICNKYDGESILYKRVLKNIFFATKYTVSPVVLKFMKNIVALARRFWALNFLNDLEIKISLPQTFIKRTRQQSCGYVSSIKFEQAMLKIR